MNTEDSLDIVDLCGALGPIPLPEDENEDENVDMVPHQPIQLHPTNITGGVDLSLTNHGWIDPVAKVTITRMQ